ncbi:MAG: hypothetical protein HOP12_00685 [Candidatus Eisenbacteria bacterium]|uniref:Porin n=1 Tax=Eiseniibacteriota bacterium TaxID=2212470 RepID=A0A849SIE1_UNCEI|nr:hypothetical protein [Candidatus Eisenbacteria bacterium]
MNALHPASRGLATFLLLLGCAAAHAQTSHSSNTEDSLRAAPGWKPGPPRVSGYVQVFYKYAFATGEDSLVDNDLFRVQRVRIRVDGDLSSRVSYNVEFDPRAPEITTVLRDAFIRFRVIPRHQIRIGQQKTLFGYENTVSSSEQFTVNPTDVADNLSAGINLRDIGVGLLGSLKLGKGLRLEDGLSVVNGEGMNVQADNTSRKNVWGRLGLRYRNDPGDWMARIGVSGGSGDLLDTGDDPLDPADDFRVVFTRTGADLELDLPRLHLSAEAVSGRDENKATGETDEPLGWYVNLVGKTGSPIGPILRYEDIGDELKRYVIGAYWGLPQQRLRFLVNYEYRKVFASVRGDDKLYLWTQVRF